DDRGQRQVDGNPGGVRSGAVPPDQTDTTAQGRGEVVGMPLERQAELEQLIERERAPRDCSPRNEPGGDRSRARPEPPLERNPVDEAKAVAVDRRHERESAERRVL